MESPFKTIGLIGKVNHDGATATLIRLYTFLNALGFSVIVEQRTGQQIDDIPKDKLVKLIELGEKADLAIVVGGDGNMLGAARVLARFNVAVAKFGVEIVNPQGEQFNPEFHQAMSIQPSNDVSPNTVLAVMQKGYTLNGRLLRPAMVMVSKAAE